jgi:hypothetical protein
MAIIVSQRTRLSSLCPGVVGSPINQGWLTKRSSSGLGLRRVSR